MVKLEIQKHSSKTKLFMYDDEIGGGLTIPYLDMVDNEDGTVCLILDGRFGSPPIKKEDLAEIAPFLANCMAVAAGYSSFGRNCRKIDRPEFGYSSCGLGEKKTEVAV